ncbi:MAG: ArsC family reductase [Gammaproteobacteria bacterium]|nr:ArsC family reductase [Gammaproteobacteria bacterium]
MSITVYGIPNCDTVKKAKKWLEAHDVDYEFHDYKKLGIDSASLKSWSKAVGWEVLLNKRGTTFRKLSDDQKSDLTQTKAIKLMQEHTSLIKRPVIVKGMQHLVGFDDEEYKKHLAK